MKEPNYEPGIDIFISEKSVFAFFILFFIGMFLYLFLLTCYQIELDRANMIGLFTGVGTSVSAFFIGYQLWLSRNHSRLSVLPEIDMIVIAHHDTKTIKITLINKGLGPAIFNNIKIHKGKDSIKIDCPIKFMKFINPCNIVFKKSINRVMSTTSSRNIISAGEEYRLFYFKAVSGEESMHDYFISTLEGSSIEMNYTSLYGEKKRYHEKLF